MNRQWPFRPTRGVAAVTGRAAARALGLLVAVLAVALTGCASPPGAAADAAPPPVAAAVWPEPTWRDAEVPRPAGLPRAEQVMAPSDAMLAWLDRPEMRTAVRRLGAQKALVDALYRPDGLQLRYDAALTRTAAQAFDDRAGNCLSLVLMTASFARALNLQVEFNGVDAEPDWWRSGALIAASGHVNVSLIGPAPGEAGPGGIRMRTTVDFVAPGERHVPAVTPLSSSTVLAMVLRNRAVEALVDGRTDEAYWLLRDALAQAPDLLAARNALAVVYLRRGWLDDAAAVLDSVLARAPDHVPALVNLAQVRRAQGRAGDAAVLAARLARLEPQRPFADYDDGMAALARGDAAAGRRAFERSLATHPQHHESHFGLALALLRQGDAGAARQALDVALRLSPPGAAQALYAAKMARLAAGGAATH